MAIFELQSQCIVPLQETTFELNGLSERADLQRLLRSAIDVVAPDTLVIAEEFSHWKESWRRIDLLGLDKRANLVVIELKRTEDGGHMELQAIRYASMVSTMSFEDVVAAREVFQQAHGIEGDARQAVLEFLGWQTSDENVFAQDVRIVLVAADFSRELTTSVLWLNERDLDMVCVRIKPYSLDGRLLLDVQQVIPLPEAAEYQVQLREKTQRERQSRASGPDWTRFDVLMGEERLTGQYKRGAIFWIVRRLVEHGVSPESITAALERSPGKLWRSIDGEVDRDEFVRLASVHNFENAAFAPERWLCEDNELLHHAGRTYAFSNQWGGPDWHDAMQKLAAAFPNYSIKYEPVGRDAEPAR